jgi:microcystin-dependent protein
MSEPFVGEIRMFGGTFAPRDWAFCAGQTMAVNQYQALFAILGTNYGGDGVQTFKLPDLRGRMPVGVTNTSGSPLPPVQIGEIDGTPQVTLTQANMPPHTHQATFVGTGGGGPVTPPTVSIAVSTDNASVADPTGAILAKIPGSSRGSFVNQYAPASAATAGASMGGITITPGSGGGITGGTVTLATAGLGQPLSIMPPFIGINFIIALQGVFPSRN